jgi:hypothetical protein
MGLVTLAASKAADASATCEDRGADWPPHDRRSRLQADEQDTATVLCDRHIVPICFLQTIDAFITIMGIYLPGSAPKSSE